MPHNVGLCNECRARVPAEFVIRDGQVWIRKDCPQHGSNESLVSSDAQAWQAKRELWKYVPSEPEVCTLKCDKCGFDHKANIVFLDLTNHCNMYCPICIATIKGMGFDYNPPISYFEKVFAHISQWDPKPAVQLFGGEPTVRDDMFDIIALGRKYGLMMNVTTNGIRLADEEYCKKFCEERIPTRFACDGRHPDIYEKLRHNRPAYEKKMKALENLKKYTRVKQTIISCFAWGINDQYLGDLIQYVHDNRDWISQLLIIPLAETWDPKEFNAAKCNTLEDAERMVQVAVPEGKVDFIPAGLSYSMRTVRRFMYNNPRSDMLLLAGVHPNCESMTALVSDGKRYRSVNHYLKVPFPKAMAEFASLCDKIAPQLNKLDPKKFSERMKAKLLITRTLLPWGLRTIKILAVCDYNPPWALMKLLGGQFAHKWRKWFSPKGTILRRKRRVLRVAMLPFEEQHSVDAGRLENCKSVFTYEDTDTGKMNSIPACMWIPYRNGVLKKISDKYGVVDSKGRPKAPGTYQSELQEQASTPAPVAQGTQEKV